MAANPSIQLGTDGNWAIKEDNLLAYKKDGTRFFNKEFDFTRGSLATFVDKDGLIKYSGITDTELVTNGDFSNWTNDNPDNYNVLNENANNYVTESNGKLRMVSDNSATIAIRPEPNDMLTVGKIYKVSVDLTFTTGTVDISGVQFNTSGTKVFHLTAPAPYLQIAKASTLDVLIDNVSVKEIQLETPRIDFLNNPKGHLLLEPQSTNRAIFSEDFSGYAWFVFGSIQANSSVSPNGLATATKLTSTGTQYHLVRIQFSGLATTSVFVKNVDANNFYIRKSNGDYAYYNFNTKTVSDNSLKVEHFANDWVRLSLTTQATNYRQFGVGANETDLSEVGNSVHIWGAQVEQQSFATSYIPTQGSTVTRNLEVCTNSGGSVEDFNGEEGVLFIDVARFKNDLNYLTLRLSQDNSEYNEVAFKFRNTEGFIYARTVKDGASRGFIEYTFPPGEDDSLNKLAFSYQENSCFLWVNGQNVGNFSGPSNLAQGTLKYLQLAKGSGEPFYGKVKNVQVFKRAMSNGELYLLTVTQYQSYQEMATALNYTL